MRADHDHRNAVAAHDLLQHVEAAHARHFEIKGDDLRLEFLNLLQTEVAVHGGADHVNRVVGFDNLRNQLAHERGIIDDQDADWRCCHCITSGNLFWIFRAGITGGAAALLPTGAVKRSTTAARFMISTTRPSPRIDAPLTKSVAMVWSSSDLITSSSSPSSESTIKPSLRLPKLMMRMKIFPSPAASAERFEPSRIRGSTWPRNCTTSQFSTLCRSDSRVREISATVLSGIA